MEKLKMHTSDLAEENYRKLAALFPNAVRQWTKTAMLYEALTKMY